MGVGKTREIYTTKHWGVFGVFNIYLEPENKMMVT